MRPTAQPNSRRTLKKDEIRVLIYDEEQSDSSGLLACQTSILKLSDVKTGAAMPYAALSYVWGDAAVTRPLICDAVEVQVTINLHYALSVIWNARPGLCLWADALSITQDNLAERSHQVSAMGDIFRSARRVLVSLGPPLRGDGRFWEFLQWFTSHRDSASVEFADEVDELLEGLPNRLALGLDDLINRPWFRRAWTYQEIRLAVAAEVFCGDSFMPWNNFVESLESLRFRSTFLSTFSPLRTFMKEQAFILKRFSAVQASGLGSAGTTGLQPDSHKEKLLELLVDGWPRDASDARDKIYAFTSSLLASAAYVELTPDYTLDMRSTFIRLIRILINNENNLEFLKFATGVDEPIQFPGTGLRDEHHGIPLNVQRLPEGYLPPSGEEDGTAGSSEGNGLPSWACDWRRQGLRAKVDTSRLATDEHYFDVRRNALPLRQSVSDFGKRLVLRGAALARAGYLQKGTATSPETSISSTKELGTFSRLPRCALHKATSNATAPAPQQSQMFELDVQNGEKSPTGSNMMLLLLQTLLHDQFSCDCPGSLDQDLLQARGPYAMYPRSCVSNLDWLFLLDGFAQPVILRPHIAPGEAESGRCEVGFDFVSVCPLTITKKQGKRRKWLESPFAYGEIVLY